jgi:hypothetical protein
MLAKNNRRAYRLLGDDVVGRHGLSVRGLFHGYSGRIPSRLLSGVGVVGRLEPAEHFGLFCILGRRGRWTKNKEDM